MAKAQEAAARADDAKDEAQAVHDRLEQEYTDASPEEEDDARARFEQDERDLEEAERAFEEAMDNIQSESEFWFEEDIEAEDF